MSTEHYIACDLGAESGRVILATLAGGRIELEAVHRFPTGASRVLGTLRWDVLRIFDELKTGIGKIGRRGIRARSISVDSWGVDYVWLRGASPMLGAPFHYRDSRTDSTYAAALENSGLIFAETGIQFMQLNTLYQLIADRQNDPGLLELADRFLNIGDYFNYLFSGVAKADESLASTTQVYNPQSRSWSAKLQETFGLPPRLFPEVVPSGTLLGPLLPEVAAECGLEGCSVVATCSHDTGAAVAAVPAQGEDWAYLSSGTWSLIGVELPAPLINERVRELNFTNEVGYGGSIRFLKNIVGLWILQECRRAWIKAGEEYTYNDLEHLAQDTEPLRSLINPNAARFLKPDDMPEKIAAYCQETGQPTPRSPGEFTRCILDSLALLYAETLDLMEEVSGRKISKLHIVGGGSRNLLLNQLAANASGRTVLAGPGEATALGNALVQAITSGSLGSLAQLRETVRASFPVQVFEPEGAMPEARARFAKLTLQS